MELRSSRRTAGMLLAAILAAALPGSAAAQAPPAERLAGSNRFATAAAVSAATFEPGVQMAFVATGGNFPDALAGGPLAGVRAAPILLTGRDVLPAETAAELERLAPEAITVLGGPPAVSDAVLAELRALTDGPVQRLAGANRFATAAAVSAAFAPPGVDNVFIATGENFPDALAGGAAGAATGAPVLLVGSNTLPAETRAELERLQPEAITVLGGQSAVGPEVVSALEELTDGQVRRLAGANRFATAAAVAEAVFDDTAPVVFLATGGNFPDALSGGPAAGLAGGPLLLVNPDCAPAETIRAVERLTPERLVVLGGTPVVSAAAAALTPCAGPDTAGVPPPTYTVDPALRPARAQVPGREPGDPPRPVARLADSLGTAADFIEAELVVSAPEGPELDALLERYGGELVATHDFAAAGLDGIDPVHVVRIDPSMADPAGLSVITRAVEPQSRGAHRVSSQAGLGTLAASMEALAGGMAVGLNYLDEGASILNESTTEAPQASSTAGFTPPAAQPYSPNAFDWAYMSGTHAQGIGVAEAWRIMEAAGALEGTVQVGVVDDGFGATDNDRPPNSSGFGSGFGNAGTIGCGGATNTCPWHGHWVASALAAQPDNSIGAAGSGGPVTRLIMVQRASGIDGTVEALLTAADNGARIINMSFSGTVPSSNMATLAPLQNVLNGLYLHHNRLMFAAAGNAPAGGSAVDIDAVTCTGTNCWEPSFRYPCEFDLEVFCVGGVAPGAQTRAPGSNWGASVDLFGPFTVFVGPDPVRTANEAQSVSGTSFATPIVAGVAALLWRAYLTQPPFANPSNLQIYRTLRETGNTSADAQVTRILNAPAAVRRALGATGGAAAPTVELIAPTGNITVPYGVNRGFEATARDAQDGQDCCTLRWTSDVDGLMAVARQFLYVFPTPGVRTVSVVATDSNGNVSDPATFRVDAVNEPPAITMTRPAADGQTLYQGVRYPFLGAIQDPNEPNIDCDQLTWSSDVADGGLPLTGCRPLVTFRQLGPHAITLAGTDARGSRAEVSRNVTVAAIPPNSPPIVVITRPDPGSTAMCSPNNPAAGEATLEPGESSPVTYRWRLITAAGSRDLGTTPTIQWGFTREEGSGPATLRLEVTDDDGTGADQITVQLPLCLR